jgi:hypothetical protein
MSKSKIPKHNTRSKRKRITFSNESPKPFNYSPEPIDEDENTELYNEFLSNRFHQKRQNRAVNEPISVDDWKNLDDVKGPRSKYRGEFEILTGPELDAELRALENKQAIKPKPNKIDSNKKSGKYYLNVSTWPKNGVLGPNDIAGKKTRKNKSRKSKK